ncbi:thiosulfate/3-mercaptopyruvate sulfurtransferase [Arthrobacter pascens]|uniref:sulfurtransferase n=1 Tax=Arthrobacter pascens TaxID=1677 RepID=UPI0028583B9B|nr:sulfurtransferase [Arthrobacter pascens]MDR6556295.1 thiosulfate/3-mercaptopyruvate sulfurtransferase [Arthrobacter pascens]
MDTLMDVSALNARLASGQRTVLLDVRWALGDPDGRRHYLDAHIPGAVYIDLPTELAAPAEPARGRHPLPSLPSFQRAARRWGIRAGDVVVAYDDAGNTSAARVWWMLRNAGFRSVCLLDGGLAAWRRAGLPLQGGQQEAVPGDVTLTDGAMPVIDRAQAADWANHGVLLDARAGERYRGEVEPVDPRAGHIPGAVSAPTTENLDDAGHFLPAQDLRRRFARLGAGAETTTAVYCGSGVTAAHQVAALEIAGIPAALFPGSFSEWSNDPSLPVATGAGPTGTGPTGTGPAAEGSVAV